MCENDQARPLLYRNLWDDGYVSILRVHGKKIPFFCNVHFHSQECPSSKLKKKNPNFINVEKRTTPHKSTATWLSFEWSHAKVSSTDVRVRTTFIDTENDSRFDFGSERVKEVEKCQRRNNKPKGNEDG